MPVIPEPAMFLMLEPELPLFLEDMSIKYCVIERLNDCHDGRFKDCRKVSISNTAGKCYSLLPYFKGKYSDT